MENGGGPVFDGMSLSPEDLAVGLVFKLLPVNIFHNCKTK